MKNPSNSAERASYNPFVSYETNENKLDHESISLGEQVVGETVNGVRSSVNEMVNFSLERNSKGQDKGRFVEKTVSHVLSMINQLIYYTTPEAIFKNTPREELVAKLKHAVKDVPFEHPGVLVRLEHVPFWGELKRLFQKGIEHRPNVILQTLIGIPVVAGGYLAGKLGRSDFYNPFTRTAVVYHPDETVGKKLLGQAYFYDQKKYPGLWAIIGGLPGFQHYKEYQASNSAMKMEDDPEKRAKMAEILQPMYSHTISQYIPVSFAPIIGAWGTKFITKANKSNIFLGKDEKTFSEEKNTNSSQNLLPQATPDQK